MQNKTAAAKMPRARGAYAVSPPAANDAELRDKCDAALRGGATILQYRDKDAAPQTRLRRALILRELCAARGALFIVNDDVALAAAANADGVHLGMTDGCIADARKQCGDNKMLLGATCKNNIEYARQMQQAGADYCAFGAVFASPTKPDAPLCGLAAVAAAAQELNIPVAAIGGISAHNAAAVFAAGADFAAACAGIFAAENIENAARRIADAAAAADNPRKMRRK